MIHKAPGCKRIIVDPNYLSCLRRQNVNLIWDGIDGIVENGIRMKTGEVHNFDVIIFGTGFSLDITDVTIRGRNGMTVTEWYATQNGPTAYKGTCIPGYPNFFILLGMLFSHSALNDCPLLFQGPNVATGHASVIFSNEVQISLAAQLMKPVLQGKVMSYELTDEASDDYNRWLQERLNSSVWVECSSYYRAGMNGKNFTTFPGPVTLFWYIARNPVWSHFISDEDIQLKRHT
jgi:hypothetical protein